MSDPTPTRPVRRAEVRETFQGYDVYGFPNDVIIAVVPASVPHARDVAIRLAQRWVRREAFYDVIYEVSEDA